MIDDIKSPLSRSWDALGEKRGKRGMFARMLQISVYTPQHLPLIGEAYVFTIMNRIQVYTIFLDFD